MKKVTITKDPEDKISIELMERAIKDVADAGKKLLNSRLTKRAIIVLIRDSMTVPMGLKEIEVVLDCAADLDKRYLIGVKK